MGSAETGFEYVTHLLSAEDRHRCSFFSSRRRHTRIPGDWSSGVCSSDLICKCRFHDETRSHKNRILKRGFMSRGGGRDGFSRKSFLRTFHKHPFDLLKWMKMSSPRHEDRKSTRLNSSHLVISYAVFCLKK